MCSLVPQALQVQNSYESGVPCETTAQQNKQFSCTAWRPLTGFNVAHSAGVFKLMGFSKRILGKVHLLWNLLCITTVFWHAEHHSHVWHCWQGSFTGAHLNARMFKVCANVVKYIP